MGGFHTHVAKYHDLDTAISERRQMCGSKNIVLLIFHFEKHGVPSVTTRLERCCVKVLDWLLLSLRMDSRGEGWSHTRQVSSFRPIRIELYPFNSKSDRFGSDYHHGT